MTGDGARVASSPRRRAAVPRGVRPRRARLPGTPDDRADRRSPCPRRPRTGCNSSHRSRRGTATTTSNSPCWQSEGQVHDRSDIGGRRVAELTADIWNISANLFSGSSTPSRASRAKAGTPRRRHAVLRGHRQAPRPGGVVGASLVTRTTARARPRACRHGAAPSRWARDPGPLSSPASTRPT